MRKGTGQQKALIQEVIEHGGRERLDEVKAALNSTGAIQYTESTARTEADKAIECLHVLPDTIYKEALHALAEFSVNRTY
jgi:octaprenyl-diphosphate synthase